MSTSDKAPARPRIGRDTRWLAEALAWGALLALALYAAAPLVYLVLKAAAHHESLSGADSIFPGDQMQYLAWIRSSGEHLLATNGFDLRAGGHVFLHPMFVISGLLWRAGATIVLSYLVWLPVAVAALYVGFRQFSWRMVSTPMARTATLILALFVVTPADPLVGWTVGSKGLGTLAGELAPSGVLYGYFPIVLTVGLLALFMLGVERMIAPVCRRARSWYIGWTAAAGMIVSWLHPWQGVTALIVIAAVVVGSRFRRTHLALLIPAAATALPLGYYLLLSRIDAAWKIAGSQSPSGRPSVLLLILAFAPLALLALPNLHRDRRDDSSTTILWLWPAAALVVYLISPEYGPHALEGMALPLAVLAVRGWQRLRWPAWAAVIAIALSTVPGLAFNLQLFHDVARADTQALLLRRDETHALAYLARAPAQGGVLPSLRVSAVVPAYTGRRTWIGHPLWTPNYSARAYAVAALFAGRLSGVSARQFLRQVGARYLLADCEPGFAPTWLGALLVSAHRFGCVLVYELAVPNKAASL